MCPVFYNIKDWLELFAYIATIMGAIGAIIAIGVIFKNRVAAKNIQIEFSIYPEHIRDGYLEIQNFTDNEFSIISCKLKVDKETFNLNAAINPRELYSQFSEVSNVYVGPHSIQVIYRISSDIPIEKLKQAKLIINTTQGKLVYKLNRRGTIHFLN